MKYRAVIFDLDGTLLNTLEDIANSTNKGLARLNFPQHEIYSYKPLISEGREFLALHALPEHHRDSTTVEKLLAYIGEEYSKHWTDNTQPYPDIPELLDSLTVRNIRMSVLSNKADELTRAMVFKILSRWHFDMIIGAMPSLPKKPDPKGALQIATQLGISPSQFLYIGDSEIDMKTARSASMYPVGVLWGFRCADELLAGGARTLIKHPQELLALL